MKNPIPLSRAALTARRQSRRRAPLRWAACVRCRRRRFAAPSAAAPPSTTRALARLVARDALTSGAQTKAFDLVKTLAAAAPEARAPLAAAFAAEAEARAADAVAALADAGAAAARRNARDAEEAAAMEKRSLGSESSASGAAVTIPDAGKVTPLPASVGGSRRASALASAPAAVLRLTRAAAAALARDETLAGELADVARAEVFETARVDALRADPKLTEAEANARADATAEAWRVSDGSDDLKKNRLQKSPDARATRDATRAFAATLEPVWAALDDAAGAMEVSPGIATAGGAEASARSRHLGLHNALLGGVDVKSILPVVEARFALAEALARAERDAEAASEPERDAEAASGRVAGADASSVDASPSVDRDSKRARVVAGSTSRDDARSGPVHVTGAPTPGGSGRTTSGSPSAWRAWPAGVRAGGRAPARGARRRRVARRVPRRPAPRRRFARPTPRSRARGTSPTRTGRW